MNAHHKLDPPSSQGEVLTPTRFDLTPQAVELHARFGWDLAVWARLEQFWVERDAELVGVTGEARRRRVESSHERRLLHAMGAATGTVDAWLGYVRGTTRAPQPAWVRSLFFCASLMRLSAGGVAPSLEESPDDGSSLDPTRYRHLTS